MSPHSKRQPRSLLKFGLIAVVIAALIVLAHQLNLQDALQAALIWTRDLGPWGAVAFIGIYIMATVLFVPGSLLTLGAGVIYGVAKGSLFVFLGASLGATIAFLIGRYLARNWVSKQIQSNTKFQAIDQAIAQEGAKIVLLTRLSPFFPFNLLNYGLGVTQVSLKDYVIGFLGMIPGTVMYVYIGSLAGSLTMIGAETQTTSPEAQTVQWVIRIVGLLATIAVTLYVTRLARHALDQHISTGEVNNASVSDR